MPTAAVIDASPHTLCSTLYPPILRHSKTGRGAKLHPFPVSPWYPTKTMAYWWALLQCQDCTYEQSD